MRLPCTFATLVLIGAPIFAHADSCLPFVSSDRAENAVVTMTLTTLNKNAAASFSLLQMRYLESTTSPIGVKQPARWVADDDTPQLFSDRRKVADQPFDKDQADLIDLLVSIEESPKIIITLRTRGNVKATFRATCSAGGVMHGSTPDVDYLLLLVSNVVL